MKLNENSYINFGIRVSILVLIAGAVSMVVSYVYDTLSWVAGVSVGVLVYLALYCVVKFYRER